MPMIRMARIATRRVTLALYGSQAWARIAALGVAYAWSGRVRRGWHGANRWGQSGPVTRGWQGLAWRFGARRASVGGMAGTVGEGGEAWDVMARQRPGCLRVASPGSAGLVWRVEARWGQVWSDPVGTVRPVRQGIDWFGWPRQGALGRVGPA